MNIIGVNVGSRSSACLIQNEALTYFNQEERLSRIKNDSGIPYLCLEEIKQIETDIDILFVTGYNYNYSSGNSVLNLLNKTGFSIKEWFGYHKSHHLVHAAKAVNDSKFEDALILVQDGHGSSFYLNDGHETVETTSVYSYNKKTGFECLYKTLFSYHHTALDKKVPQDIRVMLQQEHEQMLLFDKSPLYKNTVFDVINTFDLGFLYMITGQCCGFTDEGGKLMGLQSYGMLDSTVPEVLVDGKINMDVFCLNQHDKHRNTFNLKKYPQLHDQQSKINFSYKVQRAFEKKQYTLIKEYLNKTGHTNLILTGGTALNVVSNYNLKKSLPDTIDMFVEPLCGDEGNSIGVCNLFLLEKNIRTDFSMYSCGIEPDYKYKLLDNETEQTVDDRYVANLIADGNIVSYFQGKAEAGPRALGNRSILFDPTIKDGKDIVNTVKGREFFRPFACSILEDEAHKWFDLAGMSSSPNMMYAVNSSSKADLIPSVIHVDGTCRVQTVNAHQNKNYYNLIKEFSIIKNVPLLFNTSFNLAGDPIVHTVQDALDTVRKSNIEYLYLPDKHKLIYCKNS